MISWFEWCDVILSNSDGFWQDKSNCAMCQAQECGNMPPGHITVVKYKQRIIKKDNFHRTPDNPHHKAPSVFTMKWSVKHWKCLLLILLFPEVRPPLLVRLILTAYELIVHRTIVYCAHLPVGMRWGLWLATLSDSLKPVTRVGRGGAWTTHKEPRHRTQDACDLSRGKEETVKHWFPLLPRSKLSDLLTGIFACEPVVSFRDIALLEEDGDWVTEIFGGRREVFWNYANISGTSSHNYSHANGYTRGITIMISTFCALEDFS